MSSRGDLRCSTGLELHHPLSAFRCWCALLSAGSRWCVLARSGTKVAQLAETFGMRETTIYNWLKQERIDRGEAPGLTTEGQMELAAAKRRIPQLETELAVSRKVNEVFLDQTSPQKAPTR